MAHSHRHHHCRFDDLAYEADDEAPRRVISLTLFRTTTFINPFDELCPCHHSPSSISDAYDYMDIDTNNNVEDHGVTTPASVPSALKFIPTNNGGHSNSELKDGGGIAARATARAKDCSSQHEEVGDNSNHIPTRLIQQKNVNNEDGDNILLRDTGDRVSNNKLISGKRKATNPPVPSNSDDEVVKRKKGFIGVHHYKRTNRWEAYMWYGREKEQLWFGQHFIAEAAARTSDKAQLVLRNKSQRKLNYPEEDYDMNYIQQWRELGLKNFEEMLREQAKDDSEGCIVGLKDMAADQLRKQINEFKRCLEASKQHD